MTMDAAPGGDEGEKPRRPFVKTPMFEANDAGRYQRQSIIREIDGLMQPRQLLCFVGGTGAEIRKDDVLGFVDLLHNVEPGTPVDLMLHTVGGDLDAAEKLIRLVRAKVTDGAPLRVIIPDFAKSAGTLMALGADELVMGDTSELGTIDPQVYLRDVQGNHLCQSVMGYVSAFADFCRQLREKPDDPVAMAMVQKFDPNVVRKFELTIQRARHSAEQLLRRRGLPFSQITEALMDSSRWPSHGQMIDREDARSIGLVVDYRAPSDPLWKKYWLLHCHQRMAIGERQRVFESAYVSLVTGPSD